jgi:Spy/CpxP family protein refolding chaperone
MKISKISMAIIAATAVMAVSPAVLAQADTNTPAAQPPRAGRGMLTMEQIDKAVTLTDAEKPKVKDALEEYTKAIQEARDGDRADMRTKMTAAREGFTKKMKEILTPEQYKKLQEMPAMQPRGGRRGGGAGGAGGGANPPAQ